MTKEKQKQLAAEAALEYIQPGMIIGVGTGSTTDYFIAALKKIKNKIEAAIASSKRSAEQLKSLGIPVFDPNSVSDLAIYVDGADECNAQFQLIKGGGGAHTGEKILASMAKQFICIVDESKHVSQLGEFPIALEVLPMARSFVARELVKMKGNPSYREGFVTDHGNIILDVYDLPLTDPLKTEQQLNNIPGVVENGLFAQRAADIILLGTDKGVEKFIK